MGCAVGADSCDGPLHSTPSRVRVALLPRRVPSLHGKILYFYFGSISIISVALFVAVCAALIVPQGNPWIGSGTSWRPEEMVLLGLILLNPILLNIVLSWRHGAFWDRYVITTTASFTSALPSCSVFDWPAIAMQDMPRQRFYWSSVSELTVADLIFLRG